MLLAFMTVAIGVVLAVNLAWTLPDSGIVLNDADDDSTDTDPGSSALPPAVQDLMSLINMDDKRSW